MNRLEQIDHITLGGIYTLTVAKKGHVYKGHWDSNGPVTEDRPYKAGDTVKVVMLSRVGDCGITHDLTAELGGIIHYEARAWPSELIVHDPTVRENVLGPVR